MVGKKTAFLFKIPAEIVEPIAIVIAKSKLEIFEKLRSPMSRVYTIIATNNNNVRIKISRGACKSNFFL